jgi:hypothetical protein
MKDKEKSAEKKPAETKAKEEKSDEKTPPAKSDGKATTTKTGEVLGCVEQGAPHLLPANVYMGVFIVGCVGFDFNFCTLLGSSAALYENHAVCNTSPAILVQLYYTLCPELKVSKYELRRKPML